MIQISLNRTEVKKFKIVLEKWGKIKAITAKKLLEKLDGISGIAGGNLKFSDAELALVFKIMMESGKKVAPKTRRDFKSTKKNPISNRTKALRAAGVIKADEWLGGNEFAQVKPAVNKMLEREKHGQLRMVLNPKKKVHKAKK